MKLSEAQSIIQQDLGTGYLVSFEHRRNGFLRSDSFPDIRAGEPAIETEEAAWDLAAKFAIGNQSKYVNVYVIRACNYRPVDGYEERMFNRYPAR